MTELTPISRRYPTYPAYKPSGVPWLGEIPAHWEVRRLKHAVEMNPETLPEDTPFDFPIEYVDISSVSELEGITTTQKMLFGKAPTRARRKVRAGDTIISTVRTYLKAVALINETRNNLVVSTGFAVLRPQSKLDPKFLFRFVQSQPFVETVVAHSVGIGYPAIAPSELGNLPILVPPLPEQRAIARFLDRETGRIDALIARKQRLIELLREKRAALITRAVTRGLNPDAPLKDSGVPWLGKIPGHWEVVRLKFLTSKIGSGKTPSGGSKVYQDSGVLFIRSQNVHFDGLRLDDAVYISKEIDAEMSSTRVLPNDILLNITGASLGRASLVPNWIPLANVNQHVSIIRPKPNRIVPRFLHAVISSDVIQNQIFSTENGAAREGLPFSQIANLILALPPLPEQRAIADYLDRETARIDALIQKIEASIETWKEYRTALITAAVTGKIDVREKGSR